MTDEEIREAVINELEPLWGNRYRSLMVKEYIDLAIKMTREQTLDEVEKFKCPLCYKVGNGCSNYSKHLQVMIEKLRGDKE